MLVNIKSVVKNGLIFSFERHKWTILVLHDKQQVVKNTDYKRISNKDDYYTKVSVKTLPVSVMNVH